MTFYFGLVKGRLRQACHEKGQLGQSRISFLWGNFHEVKNDGETIDPPSRPHDGKSLGKEMQLRPENCWRTGRVLGFEVAA
jgi:hypothetical protein